LKNAAPKGAASADSIMSRGKQNMTCPHTRKFLDDARVNFVTKGGPHLASYRLRILIPARQLARLGCVVSIGEYDPSADIHVFSKHWDTDDVEAAIKSKCSIYDICDYHGDREEVHNHYCDMIWASDAVFVASPILASFYGLEDYAHITDPYEFETREPRFHPDNVNLLWYGHQSNLPTLSNLELDREYMLEIVTNAKHPAITPWSHGAMRKAFEKAAITIIPTDDSKSWKSPNRMVESINAGVFVVANDMPAYRGYEMYLGDIQRGIEWARHNPSQVMKKLKSAQKIVQKKHSPTAVGEKWYDCISVAVRSSGKGSQT